MIKNIAGGTHIQVDGGYSQYPSFYNNGTDMAGMIKFNSSRQGFDVYDGISWKPIIDSSPTIKLSYSAERAIDWVIKRMQEEQIWEQSDHPAIKAARENLLKARQQLEITAILVEQEENNNEETTGS